MILSICVGFNLSDFVNTTAHDTFANTSIPAYVAISSIRSSLVWAANWWNSHMDGNGWSSESIEIDMYSWEVIVWLRLWWVVMTNVWRVPRCVLRTSNDSTVEEDEDVWSVNQTGRLAAITWGPHHEYLLAQRMTEVPVVICLPSGCVSLLVHSRSLNPFTTIAN